MSRQVRYTDGTYSREIDEFQMADILERLDKIEKYLDLIGKVVSVMIDKDKAAKP